MQDKTIPYNNTHHRITQIAQNNIQHSRQFSICKIKRQNQEHILHTIKTQKHLEPKVDESVLKTTRYTKQWVNHTIQYSITHISPRPTPHSTSLPLYTLHIPPCLNSLPSPHLAIFTPLQIPFTSLHLSHSIPCFWKYSIFSILQPSLHFTFLTFFLKVLSLKGKFPKAFIGSLFQSWIVLFTKEHFPISILCLLFQIFQS